MKDEFQKLHLIVANGGDSPWGVGGGGGGGRVSIFYNATAPPQYNTLSKPYYDQLHLIIDVSGGISGGESLNECGSNGVSGTVYVNWCHPGSFINISSGICQSCTVGSFSPSKGSDDCTLCSKGQYQDQQGQSTCWDCPRGQFNDDIGQTLCQPCAAGSYQNRTASTICDQCPHDTYQSERNQYECIPCGAGKFSFEGATSCTLCPPGTFRENNSAPLLRSSCNKCPAGTANPNYKSISSLDCVKCPVNMYSGEGSSACLACTFYEMSASGSERCVFNVYFWAVLATTITAILAVITTLLICCICRKGIFRHKTVGRFVPNDDNLPLVRSRRASNAYGSEPIVVEYIKPAKPTSDFVDLEPTIVSFESEVSDKMPEKKVFSIDDLTMGLCDVR
jgi:hypothetical protein